MTASTLAAATGPAATAEGCWLGTRNFCCPTQKGPAGAAGTTSSNPASFTGRVGSDGWRPQNQN